MAEQVVHASVEAQLLHVLITTKRNCYMLRPVVSQVVLAHVKLLIMTESEHEFRICLQSSNPSRVRMTLCKLGFFLRRMVSCGSGARGCGIRTELRRLRLSCVVGPCAHFALWLPVGVPWGSVALGVCELLWGGGPGWVGRFPFSFRFTFWRMRGRGILWLGGFAPFPWRL